MYVYSMVYMDMGFVLQTKWISTNEMSLVSCSKKNILAEIQINCFWLFLVSIALK
jgi:hypothetical protein